jgi:hypothetical protein
MISLLIIGILAPLHCLGKIFSIILELQATCITCFSFFHERDSLMRFWWAFYDFIVWFRCYNVDPRSHHFFLLLSFSSL